MNYIFRTSQEDLLIANDPEAITSMTGTGVNTNGFANETISNSNNKFQFHWNPFQNYMQQSIRLPEDEQPATNRDFSLRLSTLDRSIVFFILFFVGIACYTFSFILFPVLKLRKFTSLWTLGSVFFITSFGVYQGFLNYVAHLLSGPRLIFSASFIGSIILTLYFSVVAKNSLLALIFAATQFVALIAYSVSYFPFGRNAVNFTGRIALSQAESWISS